MTDRSLFICGHCCVALANSLDGALRKRLCHSSGASFINMALQIKNPKAPSVDMISGIVGVIKENKLIRVVLRW